MNKYIITINKDFAGLKGEILSVLPIKLPYRPKELYRVKYETGKIGILEQKDFVYETLS